MTAHAIFVAETARAWTGPEVATWDTGIVQDDTLVLKNGAEPERLIGCKLSSLERVRYCVLEDAPYANCLQLQLSVKPYGDLYLYGSARCLEHLRKSGVAAEEATAEEQAVYRSAWRSFEQEGGAFRRDVIQLVNERLG